MIKGLCLDFDGTLGSFEGDFAGLVEELRNDLGLLNCDFESFARRVGAALQSDGHLDTEIALRRVLDELEVRPPPDLEEIARYAALQYARDVQPLPGAVELLEYARSQEIPMALVSNGPVDMQLGALRQVGFEGYFTAVLISGDRDVASRKPAARIFGLACTGLQTVPEETLMVGDSLENDIRGAQAYGMQAVLVTGEDRRRYEEAGVAGAQEAGDRAAVPTVANVGEVIDGWLR